jgi:hypothetical protein
MADKKTGIILACNYIDSLYQNTKSELMIDNQAIDYYYKMKEKFYTYFKRFATAPYSPFTDILQDYGLKIHESGIRQHWQYNFEGIAAMRERLNVRQDFMLNFDDISGGFYLLGGGCALALMAFFLEMVWFYCLRKLKSVKRFESIRRQWNVSKRNKIAPHIFIQVQPRV